MTHSIYHVPVLVSEIITGLKLQPGMMVIDGTLGGGGHAREILKKIQPGLPAGASAEAGGILLGFDQDQMAVDYIRQTLGKEYTANQLIVKHDNFRNVLLHCQTADAILLDLGVSLQQLKQPGRGFSFRLPNDPLDMRMDQRTVQTAADLVNTLSLNSLTQLLRDYAEEPKARIIARRIVEERELEPLRTVQDLLRPIHQVYPLGRYSVQQAAARTFQALRIAVNQELQLLPQALTDCISVLHSGGRLVVITFHSLEDRLVKQTFREAARSCVCPPDFPECRCATTPTIRLITRHVITPTVAEVNRNPQAHSAKLRIVEKL